MLVEPIKLNDYCDRNHLVFENKFNIDKDNKVSLSFISAFGERIKIFFEEYILEENIESLFPKDYADRIRVKVKLDYNPEKKTFTSRVLSLN
ncbi:MAG: hypothetical protein ACRC0V_05185 [Fusobacteriaceae bacterium]